MYQWTNGHPKKVQTAQLRWVLPLYRKLSSEETSDAGSSPDHISQSFGRIERREMRGLKWWVKIGQDLAPKKEGLAFFSPCFFHVFSASSWDLSGLGWASGPSWESLEPKASIFSTRPWARRKPASCTSKPTASPKMSPISKCLDKKLTSAQLYTVATCRCKSARHVFS